MIFIKYIDFLSSIFNNFNERCFSLKKNITQNEWQTLFKIFQIDS